MVREEGSLNPSRPPGAIILADLVRCFYTHTKSISNKDVLGP